MAWRMRSLGWLGSGALGRKRLTWRPRGARLSETAIQEIRGKLADNSLSTGEKLAWLEASVGDSLERSYLINKLRGE